MSANLINGTPSVINPNTVVLQAGNLFGSLTPKGKIIGIGMFLLAGTVMYCVASGCSMDVNFTYGEAHAEVTITPQKGSLDV